MWITSQILSLIRRNQASPLSLFLLLSGTHLVQFPYPDVHIQPSLFSHLHFVFSQE